MGLFRTYERKDPAAAPETSAKDRISELTPKGQKAAAKAAATAGAPAPAPAPTEQETTATAKIQVTRKKEGATRTRRQAEAERMERLHPTLTPKQQRKADSAARRESRLEAMERSERSPERQLVRDFVDTRWTVAEFMMPAMILVMVATMLTINNLTLSTIVASLLWVLLAMTIINIWLMWRSFKKLLAERVPGASTKGLLAYMFNRALMIRRFRQPGPRIKRGDPF